MNVQFIKSILELLALIIAYCIAINLDTRLTFLEGKRIEDYRRQVQEKELTFSQKIKKETGRTMNYADDTVHGTNHLQGIDVSRIKIKK